MRVHHVAITTPDVEALGAFYRDVLGLAETTRHTDEQGLRSIWLDLDGAILMVERGVTGAGGWHLLALSIDVEERDTWRQRLQAAGCFAQESGFTIYGKDPDGNGFGLSHHPVPAG